MEVNTTGFTTKYTKVYCEDEWKYNAPHHFEVKATDDGRVLSRIDFQEGPVNETGVNGVANEDLLLMVLTRLECFQNTEYRCEENQNAIYAILEAVDSLRRRTIIRSATGKEGTSQV